MVKGGKLTAEDVLLFLQAAIICGDPRSLPAGKPQHPVPLKIKLNRLHDVIQAAMGWTDSHLYEFRAGGVGWGMPDLDGYYDGPLPASKTSLLDVLEDVGTNTIRKHPPKLAITHKWNLVQSLLQAGYLRGGASPSI